MKTKFLISFVSILILLSCGKENNDEIPANCINFLCENGVIIENNGTCECQCDVGYAGTNCSFQDICVGIDCGPNGDCNSASGECECEPNYFGLRCDSLERDKFLGQFRGYDQCDNSFISITITEGNDINGLIITGLVIDTASINAVVTTFGGLSIPSQQVIYDDVNSIYISVESDGFSNYIVNDTIEIYYETQGSFNDFCIFQGGRL